MVQNLGGTINETKKKGNYITISFDDITDYDNYKKVGNILEEELNKILFF